MKYLKYYLTPILTGFVLWGIFLGGHWMWLGFVVLFFVMILGDTFLGDDINQPDFHYPMLLEIPLHLALPVIVILLLGFAWSTGKGLDDFLSLGLWLGGVTNYDLLSARNGNIGSDYIGALLGVGFLVAGYGTNVAHELTHRIKDRLAMFEGRWLLAASCNSDFAIEHVYGHHVTVGTEADPATAKRGENVYAFAVRSTFMGHLSAWHLELKRLRTKSIRIFSFQNRMITGYVMSAVWCAVFYIAGGLFGLILFLGQAAFAKFVLEIVNYMEHYGLYRSPESRVGPEHSWNTNKRISSIVLFSLTRHSAHHEKPMVKFWKLDPYNDAPQMPYGYLTTLVLCLVPPVWYRIMNPRLVEWDRKYGNAQSLL
ncbi:MAG: alkane 1-monooxygenase [Candidatus Marinimicrobia bacterium]|jgi:alkane 1-monooxygenase|nr:alkane 1-monooxygenase [Candidatus Neomarinimicrobiota bacterium]MBT3618142.1 alkane 1-monooxygenase [Candidatus Neomarinimicrobiota bacterium]MBT3828613.1 alkane 1-monooxygenase [Candidatus Neomarinimicrobiota bacterium]MBT3996925.1 alkane 1-monooxygenase [Candidatus Neomarinimicrobiota bacterium]MBT4280889.1 alkane 1-monooxygenase [Candidatus Neomarinimicrobiota bacterium]